MLHLVPTGDPKKQTYCGLPMKGERITVLVPRSDCPKCLEAYQDRPNPDDAPPHGIERPRQQVGGTTAAEAAEGVAAWGKAIREEVGITSIEEASSDYMAVAAAIGMAATRSGNNLRSIDQLDILGRLTTRLQLPSPQQTAQAAAERSRTKLIRSLAKLIREGCDHRNAVAVEVADLLGIEAAEARGSVCLIEALTDVLVIDRDPF